MAALQRKVQGPVFKVLLLRLLTALAGLELNISAMETLLYLCSGGRSWDTQIANSSAPAISAATAAEALPVTEATHSADRPMSEGSVEGSSQAVQACDHQPSSANGTDPMTDSTSKQDARKADHSTSLSSEVGMLSLHFI